MTLKTQILPYKIVYIAFLIIGFAFVTRESTLGITSDNFLSSEMVKSFVNDKSVVFSLLTIIILVLEGAIPSGLRDRLIHLRLKHPLPGARAFTQIAPKDSRIDLDAIASKHGELPTDPGSQNRLFYKLYSAVADKPSVTSSHKRYLLSRDLGTMTCLVTIPAMILALFSPKGLSAALLVFGAGIVLGLIFSVTAKNYGGRMVENALALSAVQIEQKK